jgi:hypothetical protein
MLPKKNDSFTVLFHLGNVTKSYTAGHSETCAKQAARDILGTRKNTSARVTVLKNGRAYLRYQYNEQTNRANLVRG